MPLLRVPTRLRRLGVGCVILAAAALTAGGAGGAGDAVSIVPGKNGLIVFQSFRDGSAQLYRETVPPSPVRRLSQINDPTLKHPHCYAVPAWSPDGKRIAYEYNLSPTGMHSHDSDIYVMNADGNVRSIKRLTRVVGFDGDPTWSPDGKRIAFESTRNGNSDIWVMNADGSGPQNLTASNLGFDGDPAWSPGSRKIAFTSARNGQKTTDVYLLDTANPTAPPLNLTNNPADDFDPAWSPDGQLVAFVSSRDGNDEIYETNDRFLLKRLTNDPGFDGFPAWSPDGKWIAFSTDRGDAGNRDVFYMNSNGDAGGVTELTQAPGWDQAPDWQKLPTRAVVAPAPKLPATVHTKPSAGDLLPAKACVPK